MRDLDQITEQLSSLTVMEAMELTRMLEQKWDVSALAPVQVQIIEVEETVEEEQTEFAVILTGFGERKVPVIKALRPITGLGLIECKKLVEAAPIEIKGHLTQANADEIKVMIEDAGGTADIQ